MGANRIAMRFKDLLTLRPGSRTLLTQGRIAQHVANGHAGGFEPVQELDPGQDRGVIVPLARLISGRARQKPDPLVIADRMGRQPRAFCQLSDLHLTLVRHNAEEATG